MVTDRRTKMKYTVAGEKRSAFGRNRRDGLSFFCVSFVSIGDIHILIHFYMSLYLARAKRVGMEGSVAKRIWPTVPIKKQSLFFSFLLFFFFSRQAESGLTDRIL